METIREYLNNLFMNLPETPEVLRAKEELMEMMEDKYEELLQDGKTEKEAVGIVISEFGNLEELAEELGIDTYLKKESAQETSHASQKRNKNANATVYGMGFAEAKDYVGYAWKHAKFVAVGVLLCIMAPFVSSILDGASVQGYIPEGVADVLGAITLFGMVAVAVGFFNNASSMKKKYGNMAKKCVSLDEKAGSFLTQKQEADEKVRSKFSMAGVALCILSLVPSSVNYAQNELVSACLDSSMLVIVGIGVLLLVLSGSVGNRYEELEKAVENAGSQSANVEFQGGHWENAKKKRMPGSVVFVFVLLGLLIVGGNIAGNVYYFTNHVASEVEHKTTEQTLDMGDATKLLLNLDAANVRVERSDVASSLVVKYTGDSRYEPVVVMNDNQVEIKEKNKRRWIFPSFNIFRGKSWINEVVVTVPSSCANMDYEVDVDAGNITTKNLQGQKMKFDVDAGNIAVEDCVFPGEVVVDVDAGNVNIKSSQITSIVGDVDAGNIFCSLANVALSNCTLDLQVDMGEVEVNGQEYGGEFHQTAQSTEGQSAKINLDVDMGEIKVEALAQ